MSRPGGTWRIGELARETGLTVRTLHHYDQLGLLSPLSRTEGGHRCYPTGLLRRQLDTVEERIRKASDLRARLLDALNNLGRNAEPSVPQLLQIIEETVAMNEPMTPTQFAELKEELQRQARELGEEDFTALGQKRQDTWNALNGQDQQRLTEQRRKLVPHAAGGSTKGRS